MIKNKPHKCPTIAEKILILGLLLPIFLILSINLVSALYFDNVKSALIKDDTTSKYGKLEIINSFGLGSTIAKLELKKNTDICGVNCNSETQIILYQESVLIDDVKFVGAEVKDYKFYIQTGTKETEKIINDYEKVCADNKGNISCDYKLIGTHFETEPIWEEYILGTEMRAGTYNVKLEGKKDFYSSTDWIIKSQGKEITEWADWGAGGTITYDGDYVIHTYLTDGSFNVSTAGNISLLLVAGGGGGGIDDGGGGGAGGVIYVPAYAINQTGYNIKIGLGGAKASGGVASEKGLNTTFGNLMAFGGGAGGGGFPASIGGSGGGAVYSSATGADGTPGQGYAGGGSQNSAPYPTGGGGGAGAIGGTGSGSVAGEGGIGLPFTIYNGSTIYYAGGGGGSVNVGSGGLGGLGGGGNGGLSLSAGAGSGLENRGGGGGGSVSGTPGNGGSGIVIIRYLNIPSTSTVTTTLNSPVDYYNSSSSSITFNCSAATTSPSGEVLTNISLWLNTTGNWILNETAIATGTTFYKEFIKNIPDGKNYGWTCRAFDNSSASAWATNRTLNIDTIYPTITINNPTSLENYGYAGKNETLNWTISDTNLVSVWYNYNGINTTVYGAINSTIFVLVSSPYNITLYANDSIGNVNLSYVGWSYILFENSASYNPSVSATSNESFGIHLNYNSSNWISTNAYLNYNGTNYLSTRTATTDNLIFNNTIVVPQPSAITDYNFFWNISLTNATGTYYIPTTTYTQSVIPLEIINITSSACSTGYSSAFNFTSLIESNLTAINFGTVSYNLQYGSSGNSSALVSYGSFADVPSFNICINTTSSYWVGYGEIQYQVTGYSNRRFYIFQNTRLLNTTIANNLYSLETASSTPFQITATNTALTPYVGYYISLLRWYPDLNTYKVVEMGKTDLLGQTVLNVKTNDVDYRLGLYAPDGTLIKLLNPIRMVCQTTPCVYSLIVDLSEIDLTTFQNIQSSLTYDATTKIFTYIFNDPSQDTTLMNLTVWKDYPDRNSEIICTTSSTSFTGVLLCDVSAYTGQLRAEVWRNTSPKMLIAQLLESIKSAIIDTANGRFIGLFIGFILVITMALMGVVSPPLTIILTVVALIPLVFLGVIDKAIFLIIGAIGGILLHFLRRIS